MKQRVLFRHGILCTIAVAVVVSLSACKNSNSKPEENSSAAESRKENLVRSGYTCCNLHYNGDWISDSNHTQLPFIPVGTAVQVKKIDGYLAHIEVDGKPMRLAHDYGRLEETTEQWVNKIVVLDDPKARITRFSPPVRNAISRGQLTRGMTREQVIMSAGYPQSNENPRLDGPYWRYWWSSFGPYYVHWSKGGTVSRIDGHSETVASMTYTGK